jgi:Uma2 family endonuclease
MLEVMAPTGTKATAEDLRRLHGEDSRYEIIHGEIVSKDAARMRHSAASHYSIHAIARRFDRKPGGRWPGGWWFRPELHVQYESGEVFCHDIVGFRRDLHAELSDEWPTTIRPDWVCEVLSEGHHRRDRFDKYNVLVRAGVPHYWLVSPEERMIEILRWASGAYVRVAAAGSDEVISAEPFDAVELRTSVLFGDDDDDE